MKRKWLIDFDGVMADTFGYQLTMVNNVFKKNYTRSQFTEWETGKVLTEEENDFIWGFSVFKNKLFQESIPPIIQMVSFAEYLLDTAGDEIVFVSDRPDCIYPETRKWLNREGFRKQELVFTTHPMTKGDEGKQTKEEFALENGIYGVVEDAPFHIEGLLPIVEQMIVVDYPYNEQFDTVDRLFIPKDEFLPERLNRRKNYG